MSWLVFLGREATVLSQELEQQVAGRIAAGVFAAEDVKVVAAISPGALKERLHVTAERLEALRQLCQVWDVDLRVSQISSHRKFFGPLIVWSKRLVYPVLKIFLKDTLRQQRDFNGRVVTLLAELSSELERTQKS